MNRRASTRLVGRPEGEASEPEALAVLSCRRGHVETLHYQVTVCSRVPWLWGNEAPRGVSGGAPIA